MKTKRPAELTLVQISQQFSTEEAAREYFENLRWPDGTFCPHCGNADSARIYKVTPSQEKKIRAGLYKCAECQQGFTVTVGTVMEDTHIPLSKWLLAFYMMCASKTQVSALQLRRQLEIGSYRSAWFMCHRIRYALKDHTPTDLLNGYVEAVVRRCSGYDLISSLRAAFRNSNKQRNNMTDPALARLRLTEILNDPRSLVSGDILRRPFLKLARR